MTGIRSGAYWYKLAAAALALTYHTAPMPLPIKRPEFDVSDTQNPGTSAAHAWRVQVHSEDGDEAGYETLFGAGPNRIVQDGDRWFLESDDFTGVEHGRVMEIAEPLLVRMSGLARLRHSLSPIKPGAMYKINADGSPGEVRVILPVAVVRIVVMPMRAIVGGVDVTAAGNTAALILARQDTDVQRVLELFVEAPTWTSLYKIMEVVRGRNSIQCSKLEKLGWATEAECTAFNRTANWHLTPGGRHAARGRHPEPDNPMTFPTAHDFVRRVVGHWIRDRLKK